MKKPLIFLGLLLFIYQLGHSQCSSGRNCITANMNFTPDSSFSSNADWQASHGSPSVNSGSAWMWSYSNNGEGINYNSYNFIQGRKYCITLEASTAVHNGQQANSKAFFRIVATSTNVIGTVTSSGGASIPGLPSPNQIIATENWNATSPPSTNNYSYTFTANKNFNNLWFYPSSPTLPQVELRLLKLIICDITPPPCEANFDITLSEHSSGKTTMTLVPERVPRGARIRMSITKNGANVYNGSPISYLASPGQYTICMTVILKGGTRCTKCFDLCIGEWTKRGRNINSNIDNEVISSRKKIKEASPFPEKLKEKNSKDRVKQTVLITPNPSKGVFRVQPDNNMEIENIEVYNLVSGRLIKTVTSKNTFSIIDLSKQKTGIYNAKIKLKNGTTISKKIVLNK